MEDTYKGQVDNPLSLNRYTYVHNNPLRFVDPSGHRPAQYTSDQEENFEKLFNDVASGARSLEGLSEATQRRIKSRIYAPAYENGYETFVTGLATGSLVGDLVIFAGAYLEYRAIKTFTPTAPVQGEKLKFSVVDEGWNMSITGSQINGRYYSRHALERMAPDTFQVRAELERRALDMGLKPGTEKFNSYVQPRNISPAVVEDVIDNGTRTLDGRWTFVHIKDNVKVVTNEFGDVITVIKQ